MVLVFAVRVHSSNLGCRFLFKQVSLVRAPTLVGFEFGQGLFAVALDALVSFARADATADDSSGDGVSDLIACLAVELGDASDLFCCWVGVVPAPHRVRHAFGQVFVDVLSTPINLHGDIRIGFGV